MEVALIIISTILASAFFSGVEIAFISSNRFHIELEQQKGTFIYRIIGYLVKNPSRFIAAMLVGNNIALVIYGLFMPLVLDPYLPLENAYLLLLVQTILSTIFILIFAEFLPKAIFSTNATSLLEFFALPSGFFYIVFAPIVWLMMGISNFVMKYILGTEEEEGQKAFNKVDLENYISERTEASDEQEDVDHEIQIFRNALDFSERKAREFMVPRTEIVAMDVEEPIGKLSEVFIDSNLSKILIHQGNVDNIIGYVHSFELFKKPEDIRSILRPVSFLPESMPAHETLNLLMRERRSIAVVLDEFGGTSGLVTIEDVVEEIFGEIDDEHDVEELLEQKVKEGEYLFSARQEIDYLNDKYNLKLPEDEAYNSLGGLIINHLESIPEKGEELRIDGFHLKMEEVSHSKIEIVRLRQTEDD
ncbi:hemolysin family protein [Croceimicrobium hydrocarbonivorans]|uniref:HlyC/CorC family transporter n=1 Tax=Croceimicrobium hydrocarbonivorans TaxID=2761580 RepID=A0A7H0VF27_9FLAO|nr:hemolysin family protein [Croceimicrobium hydrocarbonivorans]QNR24325.1 HlyC/CorC family transporter [Croceimicrobium hydrocarbonivorans]